MPGLYDARSRQDTMNTFLMNMKVNLSGVVGANTKEVFSFQFEQRIQAEQFIASLSNLVQRQGKEVYSISLADIVYNEIANGSPRNVNVKNVEMDRNSCRSIWGIIQTECTIDSTFPMLESEEIAVTLPNEVYFQVLSMFDYPNLTLKADKKDKLVINISRYLRMAQEGVVVIEGSKPSEPPHVFVGDRPFRDKGIFYSTEPLDNGMVKVTPFFHVSFPNEPQYHFVLDNSDSMNWKGLGEFRSRLDILKDSAKSLAQELFRFQPDAKLTVTAFATNARRLGTYSRANLVDLNEDIDGLGYSGNTCLYEVTAEILKEIEHSALKHHNILLFTDGHEHASKKGSAETIRELILSSVDREFIRTRNKFYLFTYDDSCQDDLMEEVVKFFHSQVVNINGANLRASPQTLERWAPVRELFKSSVVIHKTRGEIEQSSYEMTFDMSGQIVPLRPIVCKSGETVNIEITNGNEMPIVRSTYTTAVMIPKPISYATLMSLIGVNAPDRKQEYVPEVITSLVGEYVGPL